VVSAENPRVERILAPARASRERSNAREGPEDVLGSEAQLGEGPSKLAKEVDDVLLFDPERVRASRERRFGGPDHGQPLPRDDEEHAAIGRVLKEKAVRARKGWKNDVNAFRGDEVLGRGPGPERADDAMTEDLLRPSGQPIVDDDAIRRALADLGHLGARADEDAPPVALALLDRAERVEDDHARIVHDGIPIDPAAGEAFGPELGHAREHLLAREARRATKPATEAELVVEPETEAHETWNASFAFVERKDEALRANDVGREPNEDVTLAQRFIDEEEIEPLEVADASVDHLR